MLWQIKNVIKHTQRSSEKGQKNKTKYAKGVLKKGAKKTQVASPHLLIFFLFSVFRVHFIHF
jgi:hypothetical protein